MSVRKKPKCVKVTQLLKDGGISVLSLFFTQRITPTSPCSGESGGETGCMAPQSCVMNPAQGSPAAPATPPEEDRTSVGELDVESPVRGCKSRSSDLPFSVESLMSDRSPPCRSLHSPEPGSGCARTEECASPRGVCASKLEAVDLCETEAWLQGPSPTSRFKWFCF